MSIWNGLDDHEEERMALCIEEGGEQHQVAGKIFRHGYRSHNPLRPELGDNRKALTEETGDVILAAMLLIVSGDLSLQEVNARIEEKLGKMSKWMHSPVNVELINRMKDQLFGPNGSGGISCLFPNPPKPRSPEDFPPPHFGSLSGSISCQTPYVNAVSEAEKSGLFDGGGYEEGTLKDCEDFARKRAGYLVQ